MKELISGPLLGAERIFRGGKSLEWGVSRGPKPMKRYALNDFGILEGQRRAVMDGLPCNGPFHTDYG